MRAPGRLAGMRARARSLMADEFTAYKASPVTVDGLTETSWVDQGRTVGRVSGRSRQGDTNTRYVTVGGVERPVVDGGLHIPLDAPLPEIGWEYECTAVGVNSDPSLLGRRWRVVDVPAKSFATARRLDVIEV